MTPELLEYIKHPGLNSTLLGSFADDPLIAVQKTTSKTYFEEGKAFERLLEDKITGSDRFGEGFFVCQDIKIPDSFIDVYGSKNTLESHFVYKKDGTFNKTKESLHDAIFEAILDRDYFSGKIRYPIPLSDYKSMELSIDRLMNMGIDLFNDGEIKLKDIVLSGNYFFQYPMYWVCGGIEKKALFDILVLLEHKGQAVAVGFDVKYMASLTAFHQSFKNTSSRYTLQSQHYQEALSFQEELEGFSAYPQLCFLVATKQDPYLTAPFLIDDDSLEICYDQYCKIAFDCDKWVKEGKPITGYKKTIRKRIWRT